MAEIKEPRSAFEEIDRDIVQDWLGSPCTGNLRLQLDEAIEGAKQVIIDTASYPGDADHTKLANKLRDGGAILLTLQRIRDVFEEAARHANS